MSDLSRWLSVALLLSACRGTVAARASAWPEADALFHQEPRWLGADDAYSVDLGKGRVLWLFADSFVATSDAHVRGASVMVRNSVAVQSGADPTRATMTFAWSTGGVQPSSFFPEDGDDWFWPGDGARVGDVLLVFLARERKASGGLGFKGVGSALVIIDNPDDPPAAWRPRRVDLPPNPWGLVPGFGAIVVDGGFLHAFSTTDPPGAVSLVRWPVDALVRGDVSGSEVWSGSGWSATQAPAALFADGQSEFTVTRGSAGDWVEVQVDGFGATNLIVRTASALIGHWSAPQVLFRPPESDRAGTLVYSAKAHPELDAGGALALTYCSNSFDFATLVGDETLYFPRFVKWRR